MVLCPQKAHSFLKSRSALILLLLGIALLPTCTLAHEPSALYQRSQQLPDAKALAQLHALPQDYQAFVTPPVNTFHVDTFTALRQEAEDTPAILFYAISPNGTTPALKQYLLREASQALHPKLQQPVFQTPRIYVP